MTSVPVHRCPDLEGFVGASSMFCRCFVDVSSMFRRCFVDVLSIFRRCLSKVPKFCGNTQCSICRNCVVRTTPIVPSGHATTLANVQFDEIPLSQLNFGKPIVLKTDSFERQNDGAIPWQHLESTSQYPVGLGNYAQLLCPERRSRYCDIESGILRAYVLQLRPEKVGYLEPFY